MVSPLKGRRLKPETIEKIKAARALQRPPRLGMKTKEETKQKMRLLMLGRKMTPEQKIKISLFQKGHKRSDEFKEKIRQSRIGWKFSEETKRKIGLAHKGKIVSEESKKRMRIASKKSARHGSESHLWRGGKTALADKIRTSLEYRNWRRSIFEKDNYTCQWCFVRGGKLQADHIRPQSLFPELRFELSNGRTLCVPCHYKTGTYGMNSKKSVQFDLL